ncbi:NADH-ubiquinone oxidoreductase 21.3 kDa subunit [Fusarium keratoplasticum]|nr:NADH-ubiquinone oxidoreductase 21.3 kDa subunit [Fusarium keratoplasticum]
MSSQAAAKAAGGLVSIAKKQTVQSTGVWEVLRRFFAIDPERSNGVPLNPHFRNPPPGANPPLEYDDPVTLPAGDIADNPYWKRDSRRNYPQLSVVNQSQFAQLLTVGSAAAPKVELIGEAGEKQLVAVKEESQTGLAQALGKVAPGEATKDVFVNGLPPLPSGQSLSSEAWDVHKYEVTDTSYGEGYPCRSFK